LSADKKLRAAVVGLGGMGRRHLLALRGPTMEAVALCDVAPATFAPAAELCERPPRTYTSWHEMLEREAGQIDMVTIATNGPSHHDIAAAAARAGVRYIMCEKPMATSGHAARDMANVCAAAGARLAVNLWRRFADRFIRLKKLLAGGAIGKIRHVNLSLGAGGLGCIGTHYFDLIAWLADTTPAWVIGEIDHDLAPNVRGPQFFDPGGRGLVGYANGMTACFQLLGDVAITPLMQIVGTDGYADIDGWSPPTGGWIAVFARAQDQRGVPKTRFVQPGRMDFDPGDPPDVVDMTRACLEDLVGAHREDTAAPGIAAVDTVMAFHLSARRNWARIELPLTGEDLSLDVPIT
jgi:predicted dehydrogenase